MDSLLGSREQLGDLFVNGGCAHVDKVDGCIGAPRAVRECKQAVAEMFRPELRSTTYHLFGQDKLVSNVLDDSPAGNRYLRQLLRGLRLIVSAERVPEPIGEFQNCVAQARYDRVGNES